MPLTSVMLGLPGFDGAAVSAADRERERRRQRWPARPASRDGHVSARSPPSACPRSYAGRCVDRETRRQVGRAVGQHVAVGVARDDLQAHGLADDARLIRRLRDRRRRIHGRRGLRCRRSARRRPRATSRSVAIQRDPRVRRDRSRDRRRRAVVQIRRGLPDVAQRRRVDARERRAEALPLVGFERADVVQRVACALSVNAVPAVARGAVLRA